MPDHPTRDDIDLLEGHFYSDSPGEKYAWLHANAPVYFDAKNNVWGIASYAPLLAAEKDPRTFSNAGGIRPGMGPIPMMIDMDDPEHWKRRKLVNKGFTPRRVRESEPKIRAVCDEIIDSVCERGECDFVNDIAAWLPMILIGDMLGVAPEARGELLQWSDDMLKMQSGSATDEMVMKAMTAMDGYTQFCTHAVAERRANPTDDLMSILVHAELDGDRLADDAVLHESLLILIGGDETTRHVISGGMEQLLLHPDQHRKLIDDPSLIPRATEEMLRWVSPIKNMCRTVTHDTEFWGRQLSEGQEVLLLFEGANRDPEKFDDPFTFDIGRDPNEHVAFGFGTHYCLGQALARLELVVMFEQLTRRLPDLELATDASSLPRRPANFVSGLESMPVRFTPTAPVGAGA
ncbi:MAG TPA: cytochrome P450 [Acidimicrobiia bacterium]|nr:cytochrome P450 [Acidimicrobiia bacterium]